MATPITGGADISALIQMQPSSTDSRSFDALRSFQASSTGNETDDAEYEQAKEAATKFEALLIHNMLKSMRKTTMSENTTNQKAMYDDMLDQKLADTMVEAGGLGVAEQMMSQLLANKNAEPKPPQAAADSSGTNSRLRALLSDIPRNTSQEAQTTARSNEHAVTDVTRLQMASGLWGNENSSKSNTVQANFIAPLRPHAQQTAMRLGTTTNTVLAVAALETGWGQSMIKNEAGQSTHNYFGIKAGNSDPAYTENTTTEYLQGKPQTVQARFKSYTDPADGMHGFADFILSNPRYSDALKHAGDPERFLAEIHKAGYATDPDYSSKAITILNQIDSKTPLL